MAAEIWERKLARRLAWITLFGGIASWGIRQFQLGLMPDNFNWYLAGFLFVLFALLLWSGRYRLLIAFLVINMTLIAGWALLNNVDDRPRPGAVMLLMTANIFSAAYYGFRLSFVMTLIDTAALIFLGYYFTRPGNSGPLPLPAGFTPFTNWLSTAVGFLTMSILCVSVVSYAVSRLKHSFNQMRNLLAETLEQKTALEEKERLLKLFTELSSDYVYQVDLAQPDLVPEVFAGSFERITGYTLDDLRRRGGWMSIVHPEDRTRLEKQVPRLLEGPGLISEYRILSATDKTVWLRDHVKTLRDEKTGAVTKLIGAVHDITESKSAEQQIENLAFYDPLTALPNRRLLLDRLEQALALSARTKFFGAILFIDLDHFKNLNDTRGHEAGDQLLIQQARRLVRCVSEGDTVARLGGDEFITILDELSPDAESAAAVATDVAQRIIDALGQPVSLTHRTMIDYENTCSIGVAMFLGHEQTIDEVLRRADLAMYQAKADGRNLFRFFDPQMQKLLSERLAVEEDLKHALAQNQFSLYLQPKVATGGALIGAEVLLRWQHPEKGLLSPISFIAVAERTGAILDIGKWVLTESCHLLRQWSQHEASRHLKLSINVSARQFKQRDCGQVVRETLAETGADGRLLELELTESLAVENVEETAAKMKAVREMGVGIALDDFGTGHSSLAYLKRLPLTQLKIDQSFVRDITTDANDAILVQTIIGMAHNLKLEVIAEGVETQEQREFLEKNGCHQFQGYLFGKPVSIEEFSKTYIRS